jgi:hypothetical protein
VSTNTYATSADYKGMSRQRKVIGLCQSCTKPIRLTVGALQAHIIEDHCTTTMCRTTKPHELTACTANTRTCSLRLASDLLAAWLLAQPTPLAWQATLPLQLTRHLAAHCKLLQLTRHLAAHCKLLQLTRPLSPHLQLTLAACRSRCSTVAHG